MKVIHLDKPASTVRLRTVALRAKPKGGVDRDAHVISGASLCTLGEALGHGLWLDQHFIDSIAAAASGKLPKSRFTHPDMSNDGMGSLLGRWHDVEVDGKQARGDLHLSASAATSPRGDLRTYVENLAAEDPDAFGVSIVFTRDLKAEELFHAEHLGEEDASGVPQFRSPDKANKKNLRHARLAVLHAADCVDGPAANPDGLFSDATTDTVETAGGWLDFVLGLSDEAPDTVGGIDPTRARAFAARHLERLGVAVVKSSKAKEAEMADTKKDEASSTPKGATLAELKAAGLPADVIVEALEKGWSVEKAEAFAAKAEAKRAREESDKAKAEAESLRGQIAEKARSSAPPGPRELGKRTPETGREVPGVDDDDAPAFSGEGKGGSEDFIELARAHRNEKHPEWTDCPMGRGMNEAIKACQKAHPEAYAAWRARSNVGPARARKASK